MPYKVFISHKNDKYSNKASEKIHDALKKAGHDVFLDKASLEGGMNWKKEILGFLTTSDVVILVIHDETVGSDWVQREVDTASAWNISILPVVVHGSFEKAKEAFERFEIGTIQLIEFDPYEMEESVNKILSRIDDLSEGTISAQNQVWQEWKLRRVPKSEFKYELHDVAAAFKHPQIDGVTFCIATGDATKIRGYDILVNTENNYMQMARFFESKTLSWAIRTRGALLENERLIEDTVQDDLYRQILNTRSLGSLPVTDRTVIVTPAGHPDSLLHRQTDFRYIFHVASVRVEITKQKVEPVGDTARMLENCFNLIASLDGKNGQILIGQDNQAIVDPNYENPTSILFPVFGAGEGGAKFELAVEEFVKSLEEDVKFHIESNNLSISKIGLCIYNYADLDIVTPIFEKHGFVAQEVQD